MGGCIGLCREVLRSEGIFGKGLLSTLLHSVSKNRLKVSRIIFNISQTISGIYRRRGVLSDNSKVTGIVLPPLICSTNHGVSIARPSPPTVSIEATLLPPYPISLLLERPHDAPSIFQRVAAASRQWPRHISLSSFRSSAASSFASCVTSRLSNTA